MEDIGGILSSNKIGERGKNGREVRKHGRDEKEKKHELRETWIKKGKK